MIVRDEEARLPGCLASVEGLCSERIIVDTGSKDGTVQIAEDAGARVIHFPWCDDFAAARNAGIRAASGDWILVLDADERLGPGDGERLRLEVSRATTPCGLLELHDASALDASPTDVLSGRARLGEPMAVPRLFKRTDDLAFEGVVHESVRPWLLRNGGGTWATGARIIHYGAVPSLRAEREKSQRNARLLEHRLATDPEDFTIHGYLVHEYLAAGDIERAWSTAEEGWARVRRAKSDTLRSSCRLMTARCLMQFQRGDVDGMLATVDEAIAYEGEGPDALFFRGRAHERRALERHPSRDDELERAATAYRGCLAWATRPVGQRFVVGATSWCGKTRLGTVSLLLGEAEAALALFEAAAVERPTDEEAPVGACEALVELGSAEEAVSRLSRLREASTRPDPWLVSARAALELGRLDELKYAMAGTRERFDAGFAGPHRRELYGAMLCALMALLGRPQAGPTAIGLACGLMASDHPTGNVFRGERQIMVAFLRMMVTTGHASLVEPLLTPEADRALPPVASLVRQAVLSLGMSIEERR